VKRDGCGADLGGHAGTPRRTPRRRAGVEFQALADGTGVLVYPTTGASHALNATAVEVWELCDGMRTEAEIASTLLERYDATSGEVQQSVAALLAHLRELCLVDFD
jgi:PqqD family protein of HPr-rel-A system